jgi:2-polyprenyl-3-methyl-5-hydroxy-6-metoxy-1,4-benzoquinol methylase
MNMSKYQYPDTSDGIVIQYIKAHEPYPGYWAESEKRTFVWFEEIIGRLRRTQPALALDLGCGDGRLLPWMLKQANRVVAAEPDISRLEAAKQGYLHSKAKSRISFVSAGVATMPHKQKFDLVLFSHVLQHLPTAEARIALRQIAKVAKRGAMLLLTTTHSPLGRTYALKTYLSRACSYREAEIDFPTFDRLAKGGARELPCRVFRFKDVESMMKEAGFRIVDKRVFHSLEDFGELDRFEFRDDVINRSPKLMDQTGRDVAVVSIKQ